MSVTAASSPARRVVRSRNRRGQGTYLRVFAGLLADCVAAGCSTGADPFADAFALWLGLHGLAHQRAFVKTMPGSADVVGRIVAPLSRIGGTRSEKCFEPFPCAR